MAELKREITLIFNNRSARFQERSDDILFLQRRGSGYLVRFKSKDRLYNYSRENIVQCELKERINLEENDIYLNGKLILNIVALGRYGKFWGLISQRGGRIEMYNRREIVVKKNRAKGLLKYLAEIASHMLDNQQPEPEEESRRRAPFLSREFRKVTINPGTVLSPYLNGEPIKQRNLPKNVIYPFAVNRSQKVAIKRALSHNISIIQGPPGTGKTQSILNLIANLVVEGESVGVVSSNNSAIVNVKEKLEEEGYGFLLAHLGNSRNRVRFFNQNDHSHKADPSWALKRDEVAKLKRELAEVERRLESLLKRQERLALNEEKLKELEREESAFKELFGTPQLPNRYRAVQEWRSDKVEALGTTLKWFPERVRLSNIGWYLRDSIKYGFPFRAAIREKGESILPALDWQRFKRRKSELKKSIELDRTFLSKESSEKEFERSGELSKAIFKASLFNRYSKLKEQRFYIESYANSQFDDFIKRFPVILSTTHSILSSISTPLDYVIIDESSQVDLVTASFALSVARNIVIIGDQQQLSHIVNFNVREAAGMVEQKYNVPAEYNYVEKSIIASLKELYGDDVPTTLLKEHYRCNPLIIGFCSQKYYQGELIPMKLEPSEPYTQESYPLKLFRTAPGNHAREKFNERQIAVIEQEVMSSLSSDSLSASDIGVITPYRRQADLIEEVLADGNDIEADTVHRFQGREKRSIIFSTVANEITPFMDQPELVNVAVSRAKEQFIMVMPYRYKLNHGSNIGDLIRYIERWNPYGTTESAILSYFDLLKTEHSNELDTFKKRVEGGSQWESENIIETVIRAILKEESSYSGFALLRGYPLYLLTPNKEGLSEREISFSNHRLAHVDFLIVNRVDNSFVLAIEVDGYTYHSKAAQKERDAIKDKVLKLNGIELLRLSTRGYQESDKIRTKLKEATS